MSSSENGVMQVPSSHSFEQTVARLEEAVASRGLTVFARIDFSGDAARAGLQMRPTLMLVFGDPKSGTPLMVAAPTLAIDLPLKVVVSQDEGGRVWLSYNSPQYLKERHGVPDGLLPNISGISAIVDSVAG